jgi:hypothetical protein
LLAESPRALSQSSTERKIITFIKEYAMAEKIRDYLNLAVVAKDPSPTAQILGELAFVAAVGDEG